MERLVAVVARSRARGGCQRLDLHRDERLRTVGGQCRAADRVVVPVERARNLVVGPPKFILRSSPDLAVSAKIVTTSSSEHALMERSIPPRMENVKRC